MKRISITIATGALCAALSMAQSGARSGGRGTVSDYQQAYQQLAGRLPATGGRGWAVGGPHSFPAAEGPFSAREERKTTQTLGDGTQIESSETDLLYRDAQGRTRVEQTVNGKTMISIVDPVAGVRMEVDPAARTAVRVSSPGGGAVARSGGGARGGGSGAAVTPFRLVNNGDGTIAIQPAESNPPQTENLGQSMQNGVMAQGTRRTVIIPQGQIGNSREIRVVNEQWYSKDLQMVVRSVNSDPRFGVTTYELTNISQSAPDPSLFQAPAGFAVTEREGPVGRGVVLRPATGK